MGFKCNCNNTKDCKSFYNNNCDMDKIFLDGSNISTLNWKEIALTELVKTSNERECIEKINNINVDIEIKSARLIETPYATKSYTVALLDFLGNIVYDSNTGDVESCPCCKTFSIINSISNSELTGRKIVIDGILRQKIIYTANVPEQSTHSFCMEHPFGAYIVPYAKFSNTSGYTTDIIVIDPDNPKSTISIDGYLYSHNENIVIDLCENFIIYPCIEDIYAKLLDCNTIFKSINIFFYSKPLGC